VATYNKFDSFANYMGRKVFDLANDVCKIYLSNTAASNSSDTVKADLTGITEANNYAVANVSQNWTSSGAVSSLKGVSVTWTANGGNFGPFDKVVLYDDTPSSPVDPLIAWWEYGSSISCNNGESFTWQTPGNNLIANLT
jgi:hypothetical protein